MQATVGLVVFLLLDRLQTCTCEIKSVQCSYYTIHGTSHRPRYMSVWRSISGNIVSIACSATKHRVPGLSTLIHLKKYTQQSLPAAVQRAAANIRAAPLSQYQQYCAVPRGQLSAVPIVYHEVRSKWENGAHALIHSHMSG